MEEDSASNAAAAAAASTAQQRPPSAGRVDTPETSTNIQLQSLLRDEFIIRQVQSISLFCHTQTQLSVISKYQNTFMLCVTGSTQGAYAPNKWSTHVL